MFSFVLYSFSLISSLTSLLFRLHVFVLFFQSMFFILCSVYYFYFFLFLHHFYNLYCLLFLFVSWRLVCVLFRVLLHKVVKNSAFNDLEFELLCWEFPIFLFSLHLDANRIALWIWKSSWFQSRRPRQNDDEKYFGWSYDWILTDNCFDWLGSAISNSSSYGVRASLLFSRTNRG